MIATLPSNQLKQAEAYYNRGRLYVKAKAQADRSAERPTRPSALKPSAIFHAEKGATLHAAKR
ncbi:MAG: hypothetical protein R3C02_07670 [Planctomycetaceae bacterium]